MEFVLEQQNKFPWLVGDWLRQEEDRMEVCSAGWSCSLPTATVRAAFPAVENILSSQPDKQFSLVLPPEFGIEYDDLVSLEAFLTSGEISFLSIEQINKLKIFLEDICGSIQVNTAVLLGKSKSKVDDTSNSLSPDCGIIIESSVSLHEELVVTEVSNDFKLQTVEVQKTYPLDTKSVMAKKRIRLQKISGFAKEIVEENAVTNIQHLSPRGSRDRDEIPPFQEEGTWWCEVCEHSYDDEKEFLDHQARCEEMTFGEDREESKQSYNNNAQDEVYDVQKILARKEMEGEEKFQVLWKLGRDTLTLTTFHALFFL